MTTKKKIEQSKKLHVKKQSVRKHGELDEREIGRVAGGVSTEHWPKGKT